jgi:hypothetical protein
MSNSSKARSVAASLRCAAIVASTSLISACGVEPQAIAMPQMSTFDPASECMDLNARSIGTDPLSKDLVAAVSNDAHQSVGEAALYKVLRDGESDAKAHLVFSVDRMSDTYVVYSVDSSSNTVLRKFKLGSLHYAQDSPACKASRAATS